MTAEEGAGVDNHFDFLDNLRFQQYRVHLELEETARFHYFHGPALNGLLGRALNRHPLGPGIVIDPVESGRILFAPGESYHFGLTLFGAAIAEAEFIRERLEEVGHSAAEDDAFGAFRVGLFEAVEPAIADVKPDDEGVIDYRLRLLTPLRMERKDSPRGKRYFDPGFFDLAHFLRLVHDRVYDLCKLSDTEMPPYVMPEIPPMELRSKTLIWIDAPYHAKERTLGGIVGQVDFRAEFNNEWLHLLRVGQAIHAGRNSAFGFGKYWLEPPTLKREVNAGRHFLDLAASPSNILEAFRQVKLNRGGPGIDNITLGDYESDLFRNLDKLRADVLSGCYRSSELSGVLLPKADGSVRALAFPTVRDRVLQRAVTQILAPGWELLLEENSFAYRKGLSREGAAKAIQKAYNEGFRYVMESDIESFFDNVDWQILTGKLRALLVDDPILDLLADWLRADVWFRGQTIRREKGLPQGGAISPLLANLYLDEFDEMLGDDFRLVRYADDFVILCRSKEEAQQARDRAGEALKALALELKESKTAVIDFDRGFEYLGYIFCRSMVMETEKRKTEKPKRAIEFPSPEQIPRGSWLMRVDFKKIRAVAAQEAGQPEPLTGADEAAPCEERYPVYLADPDIFARLSGRTLVISHRNRPEAGQTVLPFEQILALVDYGKPSLTLQALTELSRNGIPTFFVNTSGHNYLTVPALKPGHLLWLQQVKTAADSQTVLRFARQIIEAKIHNYRVICLRQKWPDKIGNELKTLADKAIEAGNIDSLRGYEGRAAAVYFGGLAAAVPESWGFAGRMKHPPPDPVNAMLSFGYSCLYHHLATALQICGLNPVVGFFHEMRGDYLALACDLQEEFRFLVDALVLQLIHRRMATPDDFESRSEGPYPCLMTYNFRKLFLQKMEEKLLTTFQPDAGHQTKISYRNFFIRQARQVAAICRNPSLTYQALRTR